MSTGFYELRGNRFIIMGELNIEQLNDAMTKLQGLLVDVASRPPTLPVPVRARTMVHRGRGNDAARAANFERYRHAVDGTVTQVMLSSFGASHGFSIHASTRLWKAYGLEGRMTVSLGELARLRAGPKPESAGPKVIRLFDAFLKANSPK